MYYIVKVIVRVRERKEENGGMKRDKEGIRERVHFQYTAFAIPPIDMCAAAAASHLHATTRPPPRRRRRHPTRMQPLDRRGGGAPPVRIHAPPNLLYVHVLTISQSFALTMEMQKTHEGYRYRMDRVLVGGNT